MKRTISMLLTVAFGATIFGACSLNEVQNGDAFRPAFPDEDTLIIKTQELETQQSGLTSQSQALVGDRADLHDLSFSVAFHLNHWARNILEIVWFITRFEPSFAVEEEGIIGDPGEEFHYDARAIWGPYGDDEGKDLEWILHVWRGIDQEDGRRTFLYFIAGRPEGSGDLAWVPFLVGGAKPYEGTSERMGMVQLDMNAIASLDPTEDDVGVFSFIYFQEADNHVVAATAEGVWADDEQTVTTDANYFYGQSAEGYAVLQFETSIDLDDLEGDLMENLVVTTGWIYNGDGRSDAVISGGDLGEALATQTECWGADLRQDYFNFQTTGLEPEEYGLEDGEVANCFTPVALDLPEVDYDEIRAAFD